LADTRRGFGPLHLLVVLGLAELVVYRLLVPALQVVVPQGQPVPASPVWHEALGWLGLFLHYFVATLAIALLVARAVRGFSARGVRDVAIGAACAAVGVLAALALVVEDSTTAFLLESALALVVLVGFVASLRREAGHEPVAGTLGLAGPVVAWFLRYRSVLGLALLAAPFAIHYYGVVGGNFLWAEEDVDHAAHAVSVVGVSALCLAAILSPYCFGPRPFVRALIRIAPMAVAMTVAAGAAVTARNYYGDVAELVRRGAGVALATDGAQPDQQLALYILAFATLCWTLVSGLVADTEPRRRAGMGLALVVLAGYHPTVWPAYYAMIAIGFVTLVDVIPDLRQAERADRVDLLTPPIEDRIWQSWVTTLVGGLRAAGHHVNALTSRGEGEHASTVVTGEVAQRRFRMRVERVAGCVVVMDTRFGRDVDDTRPATFTIAAKREAVRGLHPEPPPSGGRIDVDGDQFDARFRAKGDRAALVAALDEDVRTRLTATMDGWLAVWNGESVRHRLYPGRAAPIDHPIPLSDLALRRAGPDAADRLITALGVLADVARRAVPAAEPEAPYVDPDDVPAGAAPAADESEAS
jgi:hypothetical protein